MLGHQLRHFAALHPSKMVGAGRKGDSPLIETSLQELRDYGICVSAIFPGYVATEMTEEWVPSGHPPDICMVSIGAVPYSWCQYTQMYGENQITGGSQLPLNTLCVAMLTARKDDGHLFWYVLIAGHFSS